MRPIIFAALLSTVSACNSGCAGTTQAVERQAPAAEACLPIALPKLIACHGPDPAVEVVCIVVEATALFSCWAGHQPAPTSAPPVTPKP